MKLKLLLYCLIGLLVASCSEDNEGNTLNGSWKLTNATATDGPNVEYQKGEVLWTFNEGSKTLRVKNNVKSLGPENIFSGLATGNYNYSIITEGNKSYLYVEGAEQGAFANTGENLVISTGAKGNNNITKIFRR